MLYVFDEQGVQDFLAFNIDMTDYLLAQAEKETNETEKAKLIELANEAAHEDLWHFEGVNRRGNTVDNFESRESDPYSDSSSPERMDRVGRYAAQVAAGLDEEIGIEYDRRMEVI